MEYMVEEYFKAIRVGVIGSGHAWKDRQAAEDAAIANKVAEPVDHPSHVFVVKEVE